MGGMFDETLRQLRRLRQGVTVSVALATDEKGYLDRECPNPECLYGFKVNEDDWKALFDDKAVYCPRCRHEAGSGSWFTTEQLEHIQQAGGRHVQSVIGTALRRDASTFNARQSRRGFFTMSMSYTGPSSPHMLLPAAALESLQQELRCNRCGARYAVLGCAFFCPCCGHNSVEQHFESTLRRVVESLNALVLIRRTMTELGQRDEAENTCQRLVESALGDCVSAFQAACDGLYARVPSSAAASKNVFQRLADGSALWKQAIGLGYEDVLDKPRLARLNLYFQRRHLLAHSGGLVDDEYLRKTGDTAYRVGQRIVVSQDDVRDAAALVESLISAIRQRIPATGTAELGEER